MQLPRLAKAGVDLASAPFMQNAPDLPRHLEFYAQAFWDLATSRPAGMALSPIRFEAIDRYAERYDVRDFERFHRLIKAADAAFLDHHNSRARGKYGGD